MRESIFVRPRRPGYRHLLPRVLGALLAAAVLTLDVMTLALANPGLVVSDLNHGVTATDLANALIGSGSTVTISNITYTGNARAAGMFSGGAAIVGFDKGIVLSSGKVQTLAGDDTCSSGVEGPNDCPSNSTSLGNAGDGDLSTLSGFSTFDATILEFDFVPDFSTVQFKYVFSSEEYREYANTEFNDTFAFFVNGVNCALVPVTNEPVSVNTINNGNPGGDPTPHNPDLFIDNGASSLDTQMDGLTVVLTCSATVNAGQVNHMKLAIADASDRVLDSAVFIKGGSLISGTVITTSLEGGGQSGPTITVPQGTQVTDSAILEGPNVGSAGGTVTYSVYSDAACTALFASAGTKDVSGGEVPNSNPVTFNQVGTFYWQASYSGDPLNESSETNCGEETVTIVGPPGGPVPLTDFRDVRRPTQINVGPNLCGVPPDKASINFTGSAGSSGDTWITVYDPLPNPPPVTFGSVSLSADVQIKRFDNAKGAGLLALYNEAAGKKGLALLAINNGNTDRLQLVTVDQAGKRTVLTSVSLGSAIQQCVWYRVTMAVVVSGADVTVTGQVFQHDSPTDPDTPVAGQVGPTLSFTGPRPAGVDATGEVGIVAAATSAVVDSSVTNFSQPQ